MDAANSEGGSRNETATTIRVAALSILDVQMKDESGAYRCSLQIRLKHGEQQSFVAEAETREEAAAKTLSQICVSPLQIVDFRQGPETGAASSTLGLNQYVVIVEEREKVRESLRAGAGRFISHDFAYGLVIAALRAASHAGLLKAAYRANNQKFLRSLAHELVDEQLEALGSDTVAKLALSDYARLEAEAIALEHLNQAASAAVVTATNHPRADSILSLFDTSAWLFNKQGQRRDAFTETQLWLAWYPGVENDHLVLGDVIDSMPVAPDIKIPWIVRVFENPKGWIRFRGAVDLEDHDVLHVLLGRGLQDQDEAFVVGFAMGTAKRTSPIQFRVLRFALTYLYPEPYRVPKYLQPAFNLGFQCGKETGAKDLYKRSLKDLRNMSIGDARKEAGIDISVVLKYYEKEQQEIPFTIASLRLP